MSFQIQIFVRGSFKKTQTSSKIYTNLSVKVLLDLFRNNGISVLTILTFFISYSDFRSLIQGAEGPPSPKKFLPLKMTCHFVSFGGGGNFLGEGANTASAPCTWLERWVKYDRYFLTEFQNIIQESCRRHTAKNDRECSYSRYNTANNSASFILGWFCNFCSPEKEKNYQKKKDYHKKETSKKVSLSLNSHRIFIDLKS